MAFVDRSFPLLGRRFPAVAGAILGLTLVGSILAANSPTLADALALFPAAVRHGQAWRLLTWVFGVQDPRDLLFWGVLFFFIGGDLAAALRPRRFLLLYLVLAALTGLLLTVLSLLWRPLGGVGYLTPWALADACLVAWGLLNTHGQMLFMFVLPLSGRQMVWLTVGMVVIFAAMGGFVAYLPHFLAIGLTLLYMRSRLFETFWLRLRYRLLQMRQGRRRSHLRAVDRDDDEPPRWVH